MGDIIKPQFQSEEPEQPHMTGQALCMNCRHQWDADVPLGTKQLECPVCHTEKGVMVYPAFHDAPHWECACGNEFFTVNQDRFVCAHCGQQQRFE